MVGWHHQLNAHEFEKTVGDSEGQEAWHAAAHGISKSHKQLSYRTTTMISDCQTSTVTQDCLIKVFSLFYLGS